MDQSLDDIIQAQRKQRRGQRTSVSSSPSSKSSPVKTKLSPLESSLGDIIQQNKKQYVKKRDGFNKRQHQTHHNHHNHNHRNNGGIVITIDNKQQQQQNYRHNQHQDKALLMKKRNLATQIDHSLFDARGIRDYSQVQKSRQGRVYDDEDTEEENSTIRVKQLAPSVTLSDLTKIFSVVGPLKDIDLLTHLTPHQGIVTYRRAKHAEQAIERFNGVPVDGQDLLLEMADTPDELTLSKILSPTSNSPNLLQASLKTTITFSTTNEGDEEILEEDYEEDDSMLA